MRKRVYGKQLGRSKKSRQALFRGLVGSLVEYGTISTTSAKAKSIVPEIDGMVNMAKDGSVSAMRRLYASLGNDKKTVKGMSELVKTLSERKSGYVRITKMGVRRGDNAEVVRLTWAKDKPKETKKRVKLPSKK